MSHSTTVNVNNNNTNIYLESVNKQLEAMGETAIPAGTPVPQITQQALVAMRNRLTAGWKTTFSTITLPTSNNDGGYMQPWTANVAGTAPKCVVQQIGQDFSNWGLPIEQAGGDVPETIAKTITQEISSKGGQPGHSSGTKQLTSSLNMYWMVYFMTVATTQTETGVLYAFAAQAGYEVTS